MNPNLKRFLDMNKKDEEAHALAELIQLIYRTRVRKGERIVFSTPDRRSKKLLEHWLVS
jgi:hypothetical protein